MASGWPRISGASAARGMPTMSVKASSLRCRTRCPAAPARSATLATATTPRSGCPTPAARAPTQPGRSPQQPEYRRGPGRSARPRASELIPRSSHRAHPTRPLCAEYVNGATLARATPAGYSDLSSQPAGQPCQDGSRSSVVVATASQSAVSTSSALVGSAKSRHGDATARGGRRRHTDLVRACGTLVAGPGKRLL